MSTESTSQPRQSGTQDNQSPSNSSSNSLILNFGKDDSETKKSLRRVERLKTSRNATVNHLEISLHRASQEHVQALGDMLAVNESIESLKIVDTLVPKVGPRPFTFNMVPVAQGLVQNKSITKLYVEGPCFDQDFWNILQQREDSLRELSLVRAIWSRPESFLANLVETNPSLEKLEYVDTPLRRKGAKAVGNVLKTNKTIKSLNLTRTELSHVRLNLITRGLKKNDSLLELDVSHNTIRYASVLSDALEVNHTIQKLVLDGNPLLDEKEVLSDFMSVSPSLRVLSLKNCRLIHRRLAVALESVIRHNVTLEELYLDSGPYNIDNPRAGPLSNECARELLRGLQSNYVLRKLSFTTHDYKEELYFWNSLTPSGRAVVAGEAAISLALTPNMLHRILRGGGVDAMFSILREHPNLVAQR